MHLSHLTISTLFLSLGTSTPLARRGSTPTLPYDENTIASCNSWIDNASGAIPCLYIPLFYGITPAQVFEWNPVLEDSCDNYAIGASYCIGISASATTTTTSTTSSSTSSVVTPTTTTTTTATTGITTPTPTQPSMVDGCTTFYLVESGTWCSKIAEEVGISTEDIIAWNPSVGDDCSALWADVYICIGVDSSSSTTTTPSTTSATTTTTTGNGITTPTPTQAGMVDNCDTFHYVESGESCWSISQDEGVELADVLEWNTGVGDDCTGLWAETYMCVDVTDD